MSLSSSRRSVTCSDVLESWSSVSNKRNREGKGEENIGIKKLCPCSQPSVRVLTPVCPHSSATDLATTPTQEVEQHMMRMRMQQKRVNIEQLRDKIAKAH